MDPERSPQVSPQEVVQLFSALKALYQNNPSPDVESDIKLAQDRIRLGVEQWGDFEKMDEWLVKYDSSHSTIASMTAGMDLSFLRK